MTEERPADGNEAGDPLPRNLRGVLGRIAGNVIDNLPAICMATSVLATSCTAFSTNMPPETPVFAEAIVNNLAPLAPSVCKVAAAVSLADAVLRTGRRLAFAAVDRTFEEMAESEGSISSFDLYFNSLIKFAHLSLDIPGLLRAALHRGRGLEPRELVDIGNTTAFALSVFGTELSYGLSIASEIYL